MAKYIHVITATKVPNILSASWSDPFQDFTEDPNVGGFGPNERTMWLPVIEPARPADTSSTRYVATFTDDTDGKATRGVYVAGPPEEWHFSWDAIARTLDEAKQFQLNNLVNDYQTRLDAGYLDDRPGGSNKTFTLNEESFGTLDHKHGWFVQAQADGVIPAGRKASVFADDSTRVQFQNLAQFEGFYNNYGLTFDDINEHYYQTGDAIQGANSIGQVESVSWDFSVF